MSVLQSIMHLVLSNLPAKLDQGNAVFCAHCATPLAITVNGKCIGITGGITEILKEQDRCPGTTVKLVTPAKKKGMLFAKGEAPRRD